jgi:hypothetical protein
MSRELYSERAGQPRSLASADFMLLIWQGVKRMRNDGFFDEALGAADFVSTPGPLREAEFIRVLKVSGVYVHIQSPYDFPPRHAHQDVPLLFDLVEFLYAEATPQQYQDDFRDRLNPDLALYDPPMEITPSGQIAATGPDELHPLLADPVPPGIPATLADPLQHAIQQYRRRGATEQDKRSALKHLADVLEPMKGDIGESLLQADERALFQIANKFYLRHNDRLQQRDYDGDVWLDWMFYVYVATARAMMAVMSREREGVNPS